MRRGEVVEIAGHPEILQILQDLLTFSTHLAQQAPLTNGRAHGLYSDGYFAASHLLPIQHRLSSLASEVVDTENQNGDILQAVRVSCILYTAEIRRLFGIMGVFSDLHISKLRSHIENSSFDWRELNILRTWCLAMGAMESRGSERAWFLEELEKERVGSWDEVEGELRGLLWYEDVHTPMFREVYRGFEGPPPPTNHVLGGSRFGGYRPFT